MRWYADYLVWAVANSVNFDVTKLTEAVDINCYAFARCLSYPDEQGQIYAPGRIYQLKYGCGEYAGTSIDLEFINDCIQRDSEALGQKTPQISFSEIEEDGCYYFGISLYHLCPSKIEDSLMSSFCRNFDDLTREFQWHFIMRTPDGRWLHKPGWKLPVQEVRWSEVGKKFDFGVYSSSLRVFVPAEGLCNEKFFYRIEP